MQSLVALARLSALVLTVIVLFPAALTSRLVVVAGARAAGMRGAVAVQRLWARVTLALMGVRLELDGAPPRGCFVVVANHLSYLDILVLATLFPGRFVALAEMADWPLLGWLSRSVGTIFIDRTRARDVVRVGEEMSRTFAAGVSVILFPEGRASDGSAIGELRTPLLAGSARGEAPCLPVTLHYETRGEPWAPAWTICWWGGMGFWRHIWRFLRSRGAVATVRWAPAPVVGDERKALALRVHAELVSRFRPIRRDPPPPDFPWPELLGDPTVEQPVKGP
ncbi:MAG: lysophospholipid acyltransferase family protein [Planctomycetota bacterium]|nr:lysophospholipid acyltransferase family protein [Planctomycetota bacterium]